MGEPCKLQQQLGRFECRYAACVLAAQAAVVMAKILLQMVDLGLHGLMAEFRVELHAPYMLAPA